MNKIVGLALVTTLFISAMIGEYFLAMHYYPEGCCSSIGSFGILSLLITTSIAYVIGFVKVATHD